MRIRQEESANYKSIFVNGKTLRIALDSTKPITELRYPEFYDISMGDKCVTGKCSYCYASGNKNGIHYSNVTAKVLAYFGGMTENQRPFQVAIGGQQEPLEHPEFRDVIKTFRSLEIVPNYTTNWVLMTNEIAAFTKEWCGGVAITYHKHLRDYFGPAMAMLLHREVKVNLHFFISDKASIDNLKKCYELYHGDVDYFVLLPYMNFGYAARSPKTIDYDYLATWIDEVYENGDIAFGSNMYDFLLANPRWGVSLYPPEIMSKYLVLDDNMSLYNNSFEMKPVIYDI